MSSSAFLSRLFVAQSLLWLPLLLSGWSLTASGTPQPAPITLTHFPTVAPGPTAAPTSSCTTLETNDYYNGGCWSSKGLSEHDCGTDTSSWCCYLRSRFHKSWTDISVGAASGTTFSVNASCYNHSSSGTWYIRIQTDGWPNHVYSSPHYANSSNYDKLIQLNQTLDFSKGYQNASKFSTLGGGAVGLATNGVAMYSSLDDTGSDVVNGPNPEYFDLCKGHPDFSKIWHYHVPPVCMTGWTNKYGSTVYPIGNSNRASYKATYTYDVASTTPYPVGSRISPVGFVHLGKTVIGLAFDGWPIYGPYDDEGKEWTGRDNCGGIVSADNKTYAYYSSNHTFPYLIGCFGPGTPTSSSTSAPTPSPATSSSSSSSSSSTTIIIVVVVVVVGGSLLIAAAVLLFRRKQAAGKEPVTARHVVYKSETFATPVSAKIVNGVV